MTDVVTLPRPSVQVRAARMAASLIIFGAETPDREALERGIKLARQVWRSFDSADVLVREMDAYEREPEDPDPVAASVLRHPSCTQDWRRPFDVC